MYIFMLCVCFITVKTKIKHQAMRPNLEVRSLLEILYKEMEL